MGLRVRGWSQSLLQALRFNFLSKTHDLDAYVSSYTIFCRFLIWESCEPLFMKFRPGEGSLKLNFQAVIKSAASAASPTAWELHGRAALAADLITA